jgi:glycosyltransferase involved in cell wall biosynthesis
MVTGAYFPELSGGGLQCQATIEALRRELRFAVLTTSTDPALPAIGEVDGIAVHRVHVDVTSRWSKVRATWVFVRAFLRLGPTIDVVHLHGFSQKSTVAVLLATLLRKKIVLTLHTAGQDEPAGVRAMGRLAYAAYRRADLFIAISSRMTAALADAGIPSSRVARGSNGVDTARFRPAAASERQALRRSLGLPGEGALILFVGFFSEDKGPHILFEAWRRIAHASASDSTLVYVGATNSRYYEVDAALAGGIRDAARVDHLIQRIVFVEETHIIEQYYRAADVFVFPSRREAFGMALAEAMASGLPCVASRLTGVTDEIVRDGETGLLVPPHDAEALASALTRVLDDRALAARLGAAARLDIQSRYAIEQTAQQTLAAYRRVVDRAPGAVSA